MHVVVVGAEKVGFEIAQRLATEGHDVVVIDKNPLPLEEVATHLDVMTLAGNGANPAVLEEANIHACDLLIAVSGEDHTNLLNTMLARQLGVGCNDNRCDGHH